MSALSTELRQLMRALVREMHSRGYETNYRRAIVEGLDTSPEARAARFEQHGFHPQTMYHANRGGIEGPSFDDSRLPGYDPDAPFSAHWFGAEPSEYAAHAAGYNGDTITPVRLRINPEERARREDVDAAVRGMRYRDAHAVRRNLRDAGKTHMVWDGRPPIEEIAPRLERNGAVTYRNARGGRERLFYEDYRGERILSHEDYPGSTVQYDDLNDYADSNPEIETVAVFDPSIVRSTNAMVNPRRLHRRDLMAGIGGGAISLELIRRALEDEMGRDA